MFHRFFSKEKVMIAGVLSKLMTVDVIQSIAILAVAVGCYRNSILIKRKCLA